MVILFVPKVPAQEELNRTWPSTAEMDRLMYSPFTRANAVRYTHPGCDAGGAPLSAQEADQDADERPSR